MAASSYCRRAKLQGIGSSLVFGQKEAAALIVQSRRWLYGRVKGLLYDGFFSFAIVRQMNEKLMDFECHSQYIGFNFSRNIAA